MFLTAENIVSYLIARGSLETEDVASGAVFVNEISRRNRNFRVERPGRAGLFVKQVPAVVAETTGSIYREAYCYDLGFSDPSFASLQPYIVPLVDYDPRQHTLTVEMLDQAENLNLLHTRTARFPAEIGAAQGRALGAIHQGQAASLGQSATKAFLHIRPWVLTIAQNAESVFPNMGPATRELAGVLRQNPVLVQGMYSLHSIWREETLIHGDIKWDNFVLLGSAEQSPEPELRVVDWELADIGDSSWDVGCALCCYVQHWLATMSADSSHEDTDTLVAKAPIRLEETWPAIRALWDAYSAARGFSENESQLEMRRAAAFAAARLVLTAFEITVRAPQITRTTQLCLQLAAAMMTAPEIALRDILGLREGVNA